MNHDDASEIPRTKTPFDIACQRVSVYCSAGGNRELFGRFDSLAEAEAEIKKICGGIQSVYIESLFKSWVWAHFDRRDASVYKALSSALCLSIMNDGGCGPDAR